MVQMTRIARLAVASLLLLSSAKPVIAQQTIQVFDSVCMAPLIEACVKAWPPHSPSNPPSCPAGYVADPRGGCSRDDAFDGPAVAGRYETCQRRLETTAAAGQNGNQCIRNIPVDAFVSAQTELNSILRNDMRLLLNQFCQTYAAPNTDCNKLVPPKAQ